MGHECEQTDYGKRAAEVSATSVITLPGIDGTMRETPVLNVADVVALEQRIASEGASLYELMMRAGATLARYAELRTAPDDRIVILCGSGNNGGDGWVAAAKLALAGRSVALVTKAPAERLVAKPARTAALESTAVAGTPHAGSFDILLAPDRDQLQRLLASASLIIDAILGTGFAHDSVREPYATWIGLVNGVHSAQATPIIAADCPSGLNAQTGTVAEGCIAADATLTMLAAKPGLLAPQARKHVGKLMIAPLVDCAPAR